MLFSNEPQQRHVHIIQHLSVKRASSEHVREQMRTPLSEPLMAGVASSGSIQGWARCSPLPGNNGRKPPTPPA